MLKNYITIALRNILRHKTYSFINVFGLSIGLACVILIALFVRHEWTYDTFHEHKDSIFRVQIANKAPNGSIEMNSNMPLPMGPALVADYPSVINSTRIARYGPTSVVQYQDNALMEQLAYVDSTLFDMFSFSLNRGDAKSALSESHSVIISKDLAMKLFGSDNPMGKILSITVSDAPEEFLVTGILEEIPSNSTLDFSLILPLRKMPNYDLLSTNWRSSMVQTYIQVDNAENLALVEDQMPNLLATHFGEQLVMMQRAKFASEDADAMTTRFQPLTDIYMHSDGNPRIPASKPIYSLILSGIALIVLFIAMINFIMLAVGRSTSRAVEVGIRKVVGAQRVQLMGQFWGEAFIITAAALIAGIALTEILLPTFNSLVKKDLSLGAILNVRAGAALLGLTLITALISGSYPALVLSRFHPVAAFRGTVRPRGMNRISRGLGILQYSLSVSLLVCTFVIFAQWRFATRDHPLGVNKENIVIIPLSIPMDQIRLIPDAPERQLALFRNELAQQPMIEGITMVLGSPVSGMPIQRISSGNNAPMRVASSKVDYNYANVLGIKMLEGRFFSENLGEENAESVVVNEAFVAAMGWEYPVAGNKYEGWNATPSRTAATIIGVVKDFHFSSLHSPIMPLIFHMSPRMRGSTDMLVRIAPLEQERAISLLRDTWNRLRPDTPFQYSILEEDIAALYQDEQRWGKIVGYSALLAILIACLGLFGSAALSIARRTKEIGIRKVVGASVAQLVSLLSREFLVLVVIANVIAWPIAWYAMNRWLENFAYRIDLGLGVFILAGALALVIALATVSYQAVKAATANPVDALRYE